MPQRPKINAHGLNAGYLHSKLKQVKSNMEYYRPDELARALVKLAYETEPQVTVTTAEHLQLEETCHGK